MVKKEGSGLIPQCTLWEINIRVTFLLKLCYPVIKYIPSLCEVAVCYAVWKPNCDCGNAQYLFVILEFREGTYLAQTNQNKIHTLTITMEHKLNRTKFSRDNPGMIIKSWIPYFFINIMYVIVMMKTGRPNRSENKKDLFHLKRENSTSNWLLPDNQVCFCAISDRKYFHC